MLGSDCSPCCDKCPVDGKPRTDPKDEGTWVPSGTWRGVGGVTWAFVENPGDESGETWFFFGSSSTSKKGALASVQEQRDWGNLCNWYSNKTTSPGIHVLFSPASLDKRATRLPPENAVVHIYSPVSTTNVGPVTVKHAYFWDAPSSSQRAQIGSIDTNNANPTASELTATTAAFDSAGGSVFNGASRVASAATVNGGATFNELSRNNATVNGGAIFNDTSASSGASAQVNGGATFNDSSQNISSAIVNGGATFNDDSANLVSATVNGGATFNGTSSNEGATVNDGAIFNDSSSSFSGATVNGGATFNDSSFLGTFSVANGLVIFNDAACSRRNFVINGKNQFAGNPIQPAVCNGSAPTFANRGSASCGCG